MKQFDKTYRENLKQTFSLVCLIFISSYLYAQYPHTTDPNKSHSVLPSVDFTRSVPKPSVKLPSVPSTNERQSINNEMISEDIRRHEQMRMLQQQEMMNEYANRYIPLPDFTGMPEAQSFLQASAEIKDMLEGKKEVSIKRAVFLGENAYFDNKMDYRKFEEEIRHLKNICYLKMQEEGLSREDNLAKVMMIFRVITDEVSVKEPGSEKQLTHYPMKYDFEDYAGKKDHSQTFVTKLLATNKGQCRSLPLLFLILAEEMDTEAYLSFSPEHTFIKFQDKAGRWYNAELTRGALVSDNFYMNSGFIKAGAIKNGLYLSPVSKKETVAHLLGETGKNYVRKFGYDSFVKDALETSLEVYPSNIYAHQLYSDYHTVSALYVIDRIGRPAPQDLHRYPQAYSLFNTMLDYYQVLDSLGFERMPGEVYESWLQQMEKEKDRPENQPSPVRQIRH